jgi:phospholipid/cholesterol/gamma-HCH transport system substrate-binding protein
MAVSLVKLKVGITTLIALVILFGGLIWIKEYKPGLKTVSLNVLFDDSKGVSVGDPVTLSGVKVGKITGVKLTQDNKALINFSILNTVRLNSDAQFGIYEIGLMGDKALLIEYGKSKEPMDMDRIHIGTNTPSYNDLVAKAEQVLNQLNSVTFKIDRDMDLAKLSNTFEQTLHNVQITLSAYKTIAEENRETVSGALKNMEATSGELSYFMKTNDARIANALDSFRKSSDQLGETLASIQPISVAVDTIAAYMKSDKGTMAKFIKTDALYEELRQTNATLDSFVTDFRLHPGKYTKDMKFKVRLF